MPRSPGWGRGTVQFENHFQNKRIGDLDRNHRCEHGTNEIQKLVILSMGYTMAAIVPITVPRWPPISP